MHLTLATGYRYVSSYWSDSLIDEARIESFTLWDLQARYKRPNWSLDLFIRNANNKRNRTRSPNSEIRMCYAQGESTLGLSPSA